MALRDKTMREEMKTKILFSFDCEDYTSDRSTDMLVRLGNTLANNGVVGHFQMVALLAADIERKNRQDVIQALGPHRIGYHSYDHSIHPNLMEKTDVKDFNLATEQFLEKEPVGAEIVRRVFGRGSLCSACPPGNSISYVALYGYAKMGIPVYIGGIFDEQEGPFRFCNAIQVPYTYMLEDYLFAWDFTPDAFLDMLAGEKLITLYNHPNMICHTEFWDTVNYAKGNLSPFGQWMLCPERSQEDVDLFFRNLNLLINTLRADDTFEITDLDHLLAGMDGPPVIRRDEAGKISGMLRTKHPYRNSQSELLLAAAAFLRDTGRTEYCAKEVYGFLEEPIGAKTEMAFTKEELTVAADQIREGEFLPSHIRVSDREIGPRDYLCAVWEVLAGNSVGHVIPQVQTEVPEQYRTLREVCFRGNWLNSDEFEDRYLSDRLRLQAWTMCREEIT